MIASRHSPEGSPSLLRGSQTAQHQTSDFILLAEFDELTGPRPLVTFPRRLRSPIDLDHMVLRMMTVDYHSLRSGDTSRFKVTEDTHVVFSYTLQNNPKAPPVYAYMYHFTLHDLQARGFVRPFCLSYVTEDQDKLLQYFSTLNQEFSKICRLFKFGNQTNFVRDLSQRESDLIHTQGILHNVSTTSESNAGAEVGKSATVGDTESDDGAPSPLTSDTVQNNKQSIETALEDIRMLQKEIAAREWPDEEAAFQKHLEHSYKIEKRRESRDRSNTTVFEDRIKLDAPVIRDRRRLRSTSLSDVEKGKPGCKTSDYKPKYATVLKHKMFTSQLKSVDELCGSVFLVAAKKINHTLQRFSRQHSVLMLSAEEAYPLEKMRVHVLTIGRCSLLGFHLPKYDKRRRPNGIPPRKMSSGSAELQSTTMFSEYRERTQSIQSDYRSVCTEEGIRDRASSFVSDYADANEQLRTLTQYTSSAVSKFVQNENNQDDFASECSSTAYSSRTETPIRNAEGEHPKRRANKIYLQSSAEHVAMDLPSKPGHGIVDLKATCSYLVQIVYALLRGRPVVILAEPKNEKKVRKLITTLWLFVPGHTAQQKVISWRESQPLTFVELRQIKLIGLSKKIPYGLVKSVERHVSVLDLEKDTFLSPEYKGVFLHTLLLCDSKVPYEKMLLAHIHSEFLEWASTAFLFYHQFCMKSRRRTATIELYDAERFVSWSSAVRAEQLAYLEHQEVTQCDAHIMMYWVEVVKLQQISENYKSRGQQAAMPGVKMDFATCHLFTNTWGPLFNTGLLKKSSSGLRISSMVKQNTSQSKKVSN
eukprot:m.185242 g.185242  ORF g.185242 m.185242 type:complete len:815 (-) comp32223_c1_seq1:129-2573(-)